MPQRIYHYHWKMISLHLCTLKSTISTLGCIMWCQKFKKTNFLVRKIEKPPKDPGLLQFEINRDLDTELSGNRIRSQDSKITWGWITQTLLTNRNKFFEAVRRAYKYWSASLLATNTFMPCWPHFVFYIMVLKEKREDFQFPENFLSAIRNVFR